MVEILSRLWDGLMGVGTPYGYNHAIFGAILAAIGVVQSIRENKKTRKLQRRVQEAARLAASPEEFLRIFDTIRPAIREQILAGLGPALQQKLLVNRARGGLKNTGLGAALGTAALSIPETTALQAALQQAGAIQSGGVAVSQGILGQPIIRSNTLEAITQGAGTIADLEKLFPRKKKERGAGLEGVPEDE